MSNGIKRQNKPIRVAFLIIGGKHWFGGYNYLLNLLAALKIKSDDIKPILFLGNDLDESLLKPLQDSGYEIVFDDLFNTRTKSKTILKAMILGKNTRIERIFAANHIDAVFEADMFLGWRVNIPRLSWIPDFQHKHLGHLFTVLGKFRRNFLFWMISKTRTVMLSSQDAQKDLIKFYSSSKLNSCVVPFAVRTPEFDRSNADKILEKYGISTPFFYLPNQYWVHKNHKVVLEALNILKNESKSFLVISSGGCQDKRDIDHCNSIDEMIKKYHLEKQYIMLGSIPYNDVLSLMDASSAVINPSFFEGWSTTVEEAKSLDVPLILSDINVHKEQVPQYGVFFAPNSARQLAEVLANFRCNKGSFTYSLDEQMRLEIFATKFVTAIEFTIQMKLE